MPRFLLLLLLVTATLAPFTDAFYVSWYNVPRRSPSSRTSNVFPQRASQYRPNRHPTPRYNHQNGYSVMVEENTACSRFQCNTKPCCQGECINVFGTQICILYGKRRR